MLTGSPRAKIDTAIALIQAERERQKKVEGWTDQHDDEYDGDHLLRAATIYYLSAKGSPLSCDKDGAPVGWPFGAAWWKPRSPARDLVRAGALCLAEQERLLRKAAREGSGKPYLDHVEGKLRQVVQAIATLPLQPGGAGHA